MGQKAGQPNLFIDITRVDETERMVFGYATTEALDSFGTVIDLESVQKCLPDYLVWRNIREMHQPSAVRTADEITLDDKGLYIGAHIVDDQAWEKVVQRVYKGFSIGGKKDYQIGNRIYLKKINEITLGDRPSNEECAFDTFRIYQGEEEQMKKEATDPAGTSDVKRYAGEEISDVSTALSALQSITWLLGYEQSEATDQVHPEAEEQAALLKAAIESLKKFIASEIKEDTAGVTTPAAQIPLVDTSISEIDETARIAAEAAETERLAAAGDVTRSGARHSAADLQRIQDMHDHTAALRANCSSERIARIHAGGRQVLIVGSPDDADVMRISGMLAAAEIQHTIEPTEPAPELLDVFRIDGLDRDINGMTGARETITELVTRLKVLETEPEPAKGVKTVVTVSKEQDTNLGGEVTRTAENDLEPTTDPKEAIQRIHQSGGIQIKR